MTSTHVNGDAAATPSELLLPDAAAARRLNVSVATLKRWQVDPRLAFPAEVKVGLRNFVSAPALEAWWAAQTRRAIDEVRRSPRTPAGSDAEAA